MTASDRRVVLDATAIVDFLIRGPGWEIVERLLPYSVVTTANAAEALAVISARGAQRRTSQQLIGALRDLGVAFESSEIPDALRAAELIAATRRNPVGKDRLSLSLGDGLCIAAAERLKLPIAGADQLWETLELEVKFLPYR